jgi:signal transduction histidine kinase
LTVNNAVIIDELRETQYVKYRTTIEFLDKSGIEIIAPLIVKDKTIGIIALAGKETRESYNQEDIQVLEIVAANAAIAIDNALHYEEIRKFNIKLQQEVERATEDLIKANSRLKQLDQAKSEFVSIASHQLRTPLTVIKGYISMVLDGSFGPITPVLHDSLDKVFLSNERLIQLVENLLNISRIESGRLQVNKEIRSLDALVLGVVEELGVPARKKGLKLKYHSPSAHLPSVNIDEEKIRQVVLNLIDNAIKYTGKGEIRVSLEQVGHELKVSVSDNGMGIKKEDLPELFAKFTRGTGTALVHTEGTGLGLYVADQMIKVHGGKIWAESAGEGTGSTFCFTLPVAKMNEGK